MKRLSSRTALIGVVGLGYVGLPLAVEHASAGFDVIGLDDNLSKVDKVNRGENYIPDVDSNLLKELTQ